MGEPKTDIELRFKAREIATAVDVAAEVSAYAAPGDVRDSAEMLYQWLSDGSAPRRLEVPADVVADAVLASRLTEVEQGVHWRLARWVISLHRTGDPDA
ncbi:MAG: hypothetical protein GY701_26845 [Sulfitobacter sp.]|nr:hypothetical protein [Sulfitobacter sp.]